MNEIHSRSPSTGFRDQALARLTSGPPDEGYCEERRQAWRAWVARLAARLDQHRAGGAEASPASEFLAEAFGAFLPLIDPEWWRAHPPVKLNARKRRHLRSVRKLKKRAARYRWAAAGGREGYLRLCEAIEAFARAGDEAALERCQRLLEAITDSAPPPAVAGAACRSSGRDGRPASCGPAIEKRRRPPGGRGRNPQPPRRRARR